MKEGFNSIHERAISHVLDNINYPMERSLVKSIIVTFWKELEAYVKAPIDYNLTDRDLNFTIPGFGRLMMGRGHFISKKLKIRMTVPPNHWRVRKALFNARWFMYSWGIEGFKFAYDGCIDTKIHIPMYNIFCFGDISVMAYQYIRKIDKDVAGVDLYPYQVDNFQDAMKKYKIEYYIRGLGEVHDDSPYLVKKAGNVYSFSGLNELIIFLKDKSVYSNIKYLKQNIRRGRKYVNGYEIHRLFD